MKYLKMIILALLFASATVAANAELAVKIADPQFTGSKALVKITMTNHYTNAVESARVVLFLIDDQGKVVGQETKWVIGGTKNKPALAPQASTLYYFSVPTTKPFKQTKLTFTRIILEGGKVVEAGQGFEIKP